MIESIEDIAINLLLTRRCNYECAMCMFASSPRMPADYMRWEDLLEIRMFMESLQEFLPDVCFTVNLVGGEPTMDMERFASILEEVRGWKNMSLEMTTNGWWLESPETIQQFAKATWLAIENQEMAIRISNSVFHNEFRAPGIRHIFPSRSQSRVDTLTPVFEEAIDALCDENEYAWTYGIDTLIKAVDESRLYIDTYFDSVSNVSPVGRARKNQFGTQDGQCHAWKNVKFTFMPTKDGERPGKLYDPCCNGGHVPLGYADEGIRLLAKRYMFMEALHAAHPIPERGIRNWHPNPGGGSRCWNCPSFGAKWLRTVDNAKVDKLVEEWETQLIEFEKESEDEELDTVADTVQSQ